MAKHLGYLSTNIFPEAGNADDLICENYFEDKIVSLTEFPGMSPDLFKSLVDNNEIKGFILRAFGAGDASAALRPAFEYLMGKEIPIVVTTQAPRGISNFQVNEPGKFLKDNKLAIPAHDMSIESQTTKLMWLLAKKRREKFNYLQLCTKMVENVRGEIDVHFEIGL